MPSPLGHALSGLAVAWIADLVPGRRAWRSAEPSATFYTRAGGALTVICAALAASPDLDLFLPSHRTGTHSVTAAFIVTIVAAVVTGQVTGKFTIYNSKFTMPVGRVALMCGAAYASHLLLDWLSIDRFPPRGLQILWPFSQEFFVSGLDVFVQTERRRIFSAETMRTNLYAMAWEAAMLAPLVLALWLVRVKALARFAPELTRRDHPS